MKLIKKAEKLQESKSDLVFAVVYVNSMDSATVKLDYKSSQDISKLEKQAHELLLKQDPNASDDFWIDDIWLERGDTSEEADWRTILTDGGSRLDEDMVEKVFDEPEVGIKIQYLIKVRGFRANEIQKYLDDVYVYDASRDRIVEGNHGAKYPDGWVDERAEELYSDIIKVLEKYNAESYFDFAALISDEEVNGGFDSTWIGDYFVYMYE